MKRIYLALCIAIALVAPGYTFTVGGVAHAMNVVNEVNIPLAGTIVNPCTGEVFAFSGYGHLSVTVTGDQAGGFHLDQHFNAQGIHLVGANGSQGVGNETDHFTVNLTPGAANETSNGHFSVTTQGSSPNFVVTYLLHITVNANGTVTAFADNFSARCNG